MGIFDIVLEEEKRIPAGLNEAIVYGVISLGTQVNEFQGHTKESVQVALLFETEEGNTSQTYNIPASYSKKSSLIKAIEAINGKSFNKESLKVVLESLLGKICQIDIEEKVSPSNGKTYSNIKNVVGAPKKPSIEAKEKHIFFDFTGEIREYWNVPKYLIEKLKKSPEYIKQYTVTEVLDI